ncbi:MAG: hypothetical protein QOD92_3611 [Acidimicrobiaceae bacterium]|jgi:hypothetical protein
MRNGVRLLTDGAGFGVALLPSSEPRFSTVSLLFDGQELGDN